MFVHQRVQAGVGRGEHRVENEHVPELSATHVRPTELRDEKHHLRVSGTKDVGHDKTPRDFVEDGGAANGRLNADPGSVKKLWTNIW